MGGECLNTGCVPSKALISSTRLIDHIRRAEEWGLDTTTPAFRFEGVMARMRERRAALAPNDSQERFEKLGIDVFRGPAKFLSPQEVRVGTATLKARNFVIATGSRPTVPPIEGLEDVGYFTNETVFDKLVEKPDRLAILGGGPIGCELGQAFARLGIRVTLVQRSPQILEKEDPDAAGVIRRQLEADGATILAGASVRAATSKNGSIVLSIDGGDGGEDRSITCDAVLVAAGRAPNVEGLDLESAGVRSSKDGVTVNRHLQTSQPHIYAAGDVVGPYRFTHVADLHARTVVRNILFPWLQAKCDDAIVPWCTYTSPEVARVGWNETDARAKGIEYDVFTQPVAEIDRAVLESEEIGFAKVLTRKGTDRIIGVTIVSERAGDLLAEFVLAMKTGTGLSGIGRTIHSYPTFSEIARKVADQRQKTRLTPIAKKIFGFLYAFNRR